MEGRRWGRRGMWMGGVVGLVLAAAATAPGVSVGTEQPRDSGVLVFAAASLKNALDDAVAAYAERTGATVRVSYAASPALAKQIEHGAPAVLFISADRDWMDYLQERDLIAPGTRGDLLGNELVLIAAEGGPIEAVAIAPGLDLTGLLGDDGRLAVADVAAVPAGKYAKAALSRLGAWAGVQGRLAQTENVRAALALVSRGEATLGVVYRTDAAADPNVRIVGAFPASSHPPIVYPAALTRDAPPAAADLLAFLRADPGARSAFTRQGFRVLGPPSS